MDEFQKAVHAAMVTVGNLAQREDIDVDLKAKAEALAGLLEDVAHCGYRVEEVTDKDGWSGGYIVFAP